MIFFQKNENANIPSQGRIQDLSEGGLSLIHI